MRMYRFYNYPEERQSVTILNSKMSANPNASRASSSIKHSRSNTWDIASSADKVLKTRSGRSKTSELVRQQTKSKTVTATIMSSTNSNQRDDSEHDDSEARGRRNSAGAGETRTGASRISGSFPNASIKVKERGSIQIEPAIAENDTLTVLSSPSEDVESGDSEIEQDEVITPHAQAGATTTVDAPNSNVTSFGLDAVPEN